MIQPFTSKFLNPTKKLRRLSILSTVNNNPNISQHKTGKLTRMSSSMVNNYMKEFQENKLIKVNGSTNRNQSYHLTPAGQSELISSLLSYSAEIIQLYGASKRELSKRLHNIHSEGISSVILFGIAETAEIVHTAIKETQMKVKAVIDSDPKKQGKPFNGHTILPPKELKNITADAIVITSFGKQEEIYKYIRRIVGEQVKIKKLSDL